MTTSNEQKIYDLCKSSNIAKGKLTDEFLFTIKMVDLFYYKGNIGKIDIKTGFTDGANDGGIDFIYTDNDTLYLIQGKSGENLSFEDIKNLFVKIKDTVSDFDKKDYDKYSDILKSAYLNAVDNLSNEMTIELVLFSNTIISEQLRKDIISYAQENLADFTITIYDSNDIQQQEALSDSDLVEEASLKLFLNENNKNDKLSYGEDGVIVNIMASSLKELYIKKGKTGLFNFNLREHVSQKNVDDGIDETIKRQNDKFWYFNNGITIGCNDFRFDGNKIVLYDFSIINGAQTTTKIGKSKLVDEHHDFPLVCKIVRAKNITGKDADFINKISEASNSQKPIKFRDLKSNAPEQKILQTGCANNNNPLSVEIKRGVTPANSKRVEKWQRVTNEYLGQLIMSCIFQRPGPARNAKNAIFKVPKTYNQLFMRKHDYDTLYDLVRIGKSFEEFRADFTTKTDDIDKLAVVNNGKFSILGVVCYLLKKQKKIVKNFSSPAIYEDNLTSLLVSDYPKDDLDEKLWSIFNYITRLLNHIYDQKKGELKLTSYSNFFKSEQIYSDIILKAIDEIDEWDMEKLNAYMTVFSEKGTKQGELF